MTNALPAHRRHFGLAVGLGLLGEAVGRQIQTVMVAVGEVAVEAVLAEGFGLLGEAVGRLIRMVAVAVGEVAAATVEAVPMEGLSPPTPTGSENGSRATK